MEMAENFSKWLKWPEMDVMAVIAGNGWKWLEVAESGWKGMGGRTKATIPRETGRRKKTFGKIALGVDRMIHVSCKLWVADSMKISKSM